MQAVCRQYRESNAGHLQRGDGYDSSHVELMVCLLGCRLQASHVNPQAAFLRVGHEQTAVRRLQFRQLATRRRLEAVCEDLARSQVDEEGVEEAVSVVEEADEVEVDFEVENAADPRRLEVESLFADCLDLVDPFCRLAPKYLTPVQIDSLLQVSNHNSLDLLEVFLFTLRSVSILSQIVNDFSSLNVDDIRKLVACLVHDIDRPV